MSRIVDEFFDKPNGYWGKRIATQLKIAEEIVDKTDPLYRDVDLSANYITKKLKEQKYITKDDALTAEKYLAEVGKKAKEYEILLAAHAHIDMNWMWGHDETVALTVATMRTMLVLMEEYPDFCFSQSQASVYAIIEEYAPDLLPIIKKRIKEGRWEVTASTWVEGDKNMVNGESLIRHYTLTREYLKNLLDLTDEDFDLDFEPDTFGHNANMPSIMKACGVKYYYHCRGYKTPSIYRWQDNAGAEVLSYRNNYWYGAVIDYNTFIGNITAMKEMKTSVLLRLYGVGDHGGGASRRDIKMIHDMAEWTVMPKLTLSPMREFYKRIDKVRKDLPVFSSEVNPVFTGCYTSQSEIKKTNAIGERLFFRAEATSALVKELGLKTKISNNLDNAWKKHLFNHFHDILPGSGVQETKYYALGECQQRDSIVNNIFTENMRLLATNINCKSFVADNETVGLEMGAGVGYNVKEGFGFSEGEGLSRAYLAYNSSSTEGEFVFEIPLWEYPESVEYLNIVDSDGGDLPFEIIDKNQMCYMGYMCRRIMVKCHFNPYEYKTVYIFRGEEKKHIDGGNVLDTFVQFSYWPYVLENSRIKATFNQNGDLVSLYDKVGNRQIGNPNKPFASFYSVIENSSEGMSSWKLGPYISEEKLKNVICIHRLQKPKGLTREYVFTAQFGERSTISVKYSLLGENDTLGIEASVDFLETAESESVTPGTVDISEKTVSSLVYRVNCGDEEYLYDIPFGVIRRPAIADDRVALKGVLSEKNGVFLSGEGKHGYRGTTEYMQVNLLRASGIPDAYPELGKHKISLFVGLFNKGNNKQFIDKLNSLQNPISVFNFKPNENGVLKEQGSLIKCDGNGVVSSVKTSVDGKGIVVRLYSCGDGGVQYLTFPIAVNSANICDGHENALMPCAIYENCVSFELAPYEIKTIKVIF